MCCNEFNRHCRSHVEGGSQVENRMCALKRRWNPPKIIILHLNIIKIHIDWFIINDLNVEQLRIKQRTPLPSQRTKLNSFHQRNVVFWVCSTVEEIRNSSVVLRGGISRILTETFYRELFNWILVTFYWILRGEGIVERNQMNLSNQIQLKNGKYY